jgi:hypothetical protein
MLAARDSIAVGGGCVIICTEKTVSTRRALTFLHPDRVDVVIYFLCTLHLIQSPSLTTTDAWSFVRRFEVRASHTAQSIALPVQPSPVETSVDSSRLVWRPTSSNMGSTRLAICPEGYFVSKHSVPTFSTAAESASILTFTRISPHPAPLLSCVASFLYPYSSSLHYRVSLFPTPSVADSLRTASYSTIKPH